MNTIAKRTLLSAANHKAFTYYRRHPVAERGPSEYLEISDGPSRASVHFGALVRQHLSSVRALRSISAPARHVRQISAYAGMTNLLSRRVSVSLDIKRHAKRNHRIVALTCIAMLAMPAIAVSRTHELKASTTTVHRGFFDATLKPVLTIESGDSVKLETATGNPRWFENLGVPKEKIPAELYAVYEGVEGAGRGDHTLNGPIEVRGAEPGDMLEIRIKSVDVRLPIAGQSFNVNRGVLPDQFPTPKSRVLWIDLKSKTIEYAPGVVVPTKPFWGVMGTAPPAEMGRVPSGAPNFFGGNLDNRDLGAGATLYLPVSVAGALLSFGDGHAAQGHGEVCVSAVETSLKGEVQVILHKGVTLKWPRAETPTHYMTMGLNVDLDEAARLATSNMLDLLVATKGLSREDAYMLASASMALIITQAVDGTKGVHAMMPKDVFRK